MVSNIIKTLIVLALVVGLFLGSIVGLAWYNARADKIGEPDRANFKDLGLPGTDRPTGGKTRSTAAKSEKKASGKDVTAPTTPAVDTPAPTEKTDKGTASSKPEKTGPAEKTEPAKKEPEKKDAGTGSQSKTPNVPKD